jgi:hypothetical protein
LEVVEIRLIGRQSCKTATIAPIAELGFYGAYKSQQDMAESPVFDRIAFASCPPQNRTAYVPSREKPGQ